MNRLSFVAIVALLVFATDRAAAGPRTAPAAGDSSASAVSPVLGDLHKLTLLATEQSIFIPCYAFFTLGANQDDWKPGVSSCYLLEKNQTIGLAAPVNFPVVTGKLKVKSVRCMSETSFGDDQIEYKATLGSIAKIEAKHGESKQKTVTKEATINQASNEVDAATRNYDLVINWRVNVAAGAGWQPQSDQFKGCRIDYVVLNY